MTNKEFITQLRAAATRVVRSYPDIFRVLPEVRIDSRGTPSLPVVLTFRWRKYGNEVMVCVVCSSKGRVIYEVYGPRGGRYSAAFEHIAWDVREALLDLYKYDKYVLYTI